MSRAIKGSLGFLGVVDWRPGRRCGLSRPRKQRQSVESPRTVLFAPHSFSSAGFTGNGERSCCRQDHRRLSRRVCDGSSSSRIYRL
eukprot:scaffold281995_cov15-Prasinocladus_malaysianus.AAC.2